MIDLAVKTGSEKVEFTAIDTIPGKTDRLLLDNNQRQSLSVKCRQLKQKYQAAPFRSILDIFRFDEFIRRISNIDAGTAEYDSNIIGSMPCYAGWIFVRILADGNVNSCLKSHRYPVGNILQQSFKSIWNNARQKHFREKTLTFDNSDFFFSLIGNDPERDIGCYKSCDNIGHNMYMHGKVSSLSRIERVILNTLVRIAERVRSKK